MLSGLSHDGCLGGLSEEGCRLVGTLSEDGCWLVGGLSEDCCLVLALSESCCLEPNKPFCSPPVKHSKLKLEDLKVLRRSPDPLNNVKIGQG